MFKKTIRLNRLVFTEYFKTGRRYHSDNFTLVYTKQVPFGVAVVVGKKVYKLAIARNTLKRRVYAAVHQCIKLTNVQAGGFIIIAKPTAKNLYRKAIALEINTLLAQTDKSR